MFQVYLHPLRVVHLAGAVQIQYTLLLVNWTRVNHCSGPAHAYFQPLQLQIYLHVLYEM